MGVTDRKKQLFENVLRLRRAEREFPQNEDIARVRVDLEHELGTTVSQRLAAELLGVSHTALRRWVEAGDVSLVPTVGGRSEVPLDTILDLHDGVERARSDGRRRRVLEPTLTEGRSRAANLRAAVRASAQDADREPHGRADRRSLAYHRAVARRLRRADVDEALHQIWAWRNAGTLDPRYAERWEEILRRPVAEVRRAITEDSPAGRDLRQTSPFAGMLSEPERRTILEEVR